MGRAAAVCCLAATANLSAEEEPVAIERPTSPAEATTGVTPPSPAPQASPSVGEILPPPEPADTEPTDEDQRAAALERIADSLSERMQAVLKRERTLDAREDVMAEREAALDARVRAIMAREAALEARENYLRRREQLPAPQAWEGPPAPEIHGRYAAVIDGRSGQFFHVKDAQVQTPVASTQKLLTALLVIQDGDLEKVIEVPREVYDTEPTHIGIKPGQHYKRSDLVRALLIRSGNDVAACLAVDNAGSIEAFAKKMNDYARFIGATDSNFINPHGLPAEGQVSTARDMALIAFEAYQNDFVRECIQIATWDFVFEDGTTRTLYNTNKVLRDFEPCNGMKTGYTIASGHCLISSGAMPGEDGVDRIAVVIGSDRSNVWKDSRSLLEWALNLKMEDS